MEGKVDRKAILRGDVQIFLKDVQYFLNEDLERCMITNFTAHMVAIVEKDGRCYAAMPFDSAFMGMLYETRDSFDDLAAQYQGKEISGGNAPEKEE